MTEELLSDDCNCNIGVDGDANVDGANVGDGDADDSSDVEDANVDGGNVDDGSDVNGSDVDANFDGGDGDVDIEILGDVDIEVLGDVDIEVFGDVDNEMFGDVEGSNVNNDDDSFIKWQSISQPLTAFGGITPKSQVSEPTNKPSPQIGVQTLGEVWVQFQPRSI